MGVFKTSNKDDDDFSAFSWCVQYIVDESK